MHQEEHSGHATVRIRGGWAARGPRNLLLKANPFWDAVSKTTVCLMLRDGVWRRETRRHACEGHSKKSAEVLQAFSGM